MIINKSTHRLTLDKLENKHLTFTSRINDTVEIRVYSSKLNTTFYVTTLDIQNGHGYFISHPCFLILRDIDIDFTFTDKSTDKLTLTEELIAQPNHILNYYSNDEYELLEPYINLSYVEVIVDDNYKILDLTDNFFDNIKTVVDLGGNIGTFERLILNQCKNLEEYIVVEPTQSLLNVIELHNKNDKRVIYNRAFDSVNKSIKFLYSDDVWRSEANSTLGSMDEVPDLVNEVEIETITLKEIVENCKNNIIDLLKVDIEGSEVHLYKGDNIKYLNSVRYIIVEAHTEEIKNDIINNLSNFEVISINYAGLPHIFMRNKKLTSFNPAQKKKIILKVSCPALGDILCSTPTIRKVAESYGHKVDVMTKRADVFKNNPYVNKIIEYTEDDPVGYDEIFETYNQYYKVNRNMSSNSFYENPIEVKLSNFEARQLHAMGVGITLYPDEMSYDFIPDKQTEISKQIDDNFIVLHVTENWPVRTWSMDKWQRLVDLIKEKTDYKIVTIGKAHQEDGHFGKINKDVISLDNVDVDTCLYENVGRQDHIQLGEGSLSELWHILNNAKALVSFDTGPVHLAGTTDTHIIQIGSSIRYEKTAPYRHGTQNYKFDFVGGECKIFCASDPKYSVKEWGTINSMPYYPKCQENYSEFKCQPTVEQILNKIIEL